MDTIFHIDLQSVLAGPGPIILNLGCGTRKHPGMIGIDRLNLPEVEIVADLEKGLPFLPDNSIDIIQSRSFLEHVDHLETIMSESWRVLKPEGQKKLFVPHFSNPYYYSDYTHKRFFGLYSFEYFSKSQTRFHRKVPSFYSNFEFKTIDIMLAFSSHWKIGKIWKALAQKLFNLTPGWQEFYEENLCYLIPCYGIQAVLQPIKPNS